VVHPDDEISIDVVMHPRRLRERTLLATFSSDELTEVEGETTVYVVSKSEWEEKEKNGMIIVVLMA
jgi:hypothetical protein